MADPPGSTLDRRRFLVVLGGATAGAVIGNRLAWAARAAPGGVPRLQPWTLPDDAPANPVDAARALVGAAVLAPSECNAQPWWFEGDGSTVRLLADPQRALPALDPDRRAMMVSLGAGLENLLIAARAWGLQPTTSYFPRPGSRLIAEVTWRAGGTRRDRAMFGSIPARRTNRRDFDGRGLFPQNRAQLLAQAPAGRLHWLDDGPAMSDLADLVHDATWDQVENRRMEAEQFAWLRFGDAAQRRGDGVPVGALELSTLARWMARRYLDPGSWFLRFGADGLAKQARNAIRSAGAVALLTASESTDQARVMAGQAFERVVLKATQLGIAHQPMNAPIRIERYRGELARMFGAGTGEDPLLLLRFGHARPPDPTPRRSAWLVTSFRTS